MLRECRGVHLEKEIKCMYGTVVFEFTVGNCIQLKQDLLELNVIGLCVEFSRLLETEFAGLTFSNTIGNRNDHSKHKS